MSDAFPAHWREFYRAETASTQDEARLLAQLPFDGPYWIRAGHQSAGRGRRGRRWIASEGALAASWIGLLDGPALRLAQLGFALGLAAHQAVSLDFGLDAVALKWPNDLLIDGRKAGGILLESWPAADGRFFLAAGIGLNLATAPVLADRPSAACGPIAAEDALAAIARRFAALGDLLWREGFAALAPLWTAAAWGLGEPIAVEAGGRCHTGVFLGLDHQGALRLRISSGAVLAIAAGDVMVPTDWTVPPVNGFG